MRAILVETDKRTIREIEFEGTLQHAYDLLDCRLIQGVYLPADIIFVDEEGLLTPKTQAKGFFRWHTFPQALAGRGLIVGDGGEDWTDVKMSLDFATGGVAWLP